MSDFWKDIWDSKGRSDSKDLLWLCGREHLDIPWNSKKEFENIKHLLNLKENDKVLEVGCGAGFLSREFVDYDYRGVDYSKSLIQKHKEGCFRIYIYCNAIKRSYYSRGSTRFRKDFNY